MTACQLAGQTGLVTGGGRGIGAALARALAGQGASVWVTGRTEADLERSVARIHADGGQAQAVVADVTDEAGMCALFERVAAQAGRLDVLIVNAGLIPSPGPSGQSALPGWRDTFEVNLFGALNSVMPALPLLRRARGRIIVVGSGAGHQPVSAVASYSCSKAATWMLVRCLSEELRGDGISVNELVPGPVVTERERAIAPADEPPFLASEWIKQPEDVAPLALFLACQPAGAGPTGQSFSLTRRLL